MNAPVEDPIGLSPADDAGLGPKGMAQWIERLERLEALQTLPDKPEESTASTLRTLWLLACGERLSSQAAAERTPRALTAAEAHTLDTLIDRRLAGVPLAHLSQRQRFMGLEMLAGPDALIPRAETELLARGAIEVLQGVSAGGDRTPLVLDVCCGCGNVAAAMAAAVPTAQVHAADLSPEATAFARLNMVHLGLADRVTVHEGDLLAPFEHETFLGQVDVLTGNPPYISTGRLATMPGEIVGHEPTLAFDGGPLGIRILQRLIREAPRYLRPGGWLAFEMGLGQGPAVLQRLKASGRFETVEALSDAVGEVRAVRARTPRT